MIPYNIIEIANTHGGSLSYLMSLIKEYQQFTDGFGIKFQPFKYDEIATSDYEWYPVYQELYFDEKEWQKIIKEANKTKDVWIDLFDNYGVHILEKNIKSIHGIKFQTSVLNNKRLIQELSKLELSDLNLIVNIAARTEEEISSILTTLQSQLNVKEILLEVGFQSYPTRLADAGINKIKQIKEKFGKKIVFADHVAGESTDAIYLPSIALLFGADVIEKHVMHSKLETKYDHFSSIVFQDYEKMIELQKAYSSLQDQPFITVKEQEYLTKSILIPILEKDLKKGQSVNLERDFLFKRSGKQGLKVSEIDQYSKTYHVLRKDKKSGDTLLAEDFKKANIAVIIACRLKSSRLKEKAKLLIGDLSSIELCIKHTLSFQNISNVILATSTVEQDAELKNFTYDDSVIFHQGHPDDVIKRYLDVIDQLKIDTIIRVTGDMPFVSNDIAQLLLAAHFKSGADYTVGSKAAIGTNLEIINTKALQKVKSHFPNAEYSEYMTWYFQNNPEHFKLNFVDLPDKYIRDYRLTIDYEEDLIMFNAIMAHFKETGRNFSIEKLFDFLDNNPNIANINQHLTLKYKTDANLIKTLNEKTKIKSLATV